MTTTPQPAAPVTPLGRLLEDEGRKQSWLAARTGIDPADISRIVNGMVPSKNRAQAIARELRRTPTELGWPQYDDESQAA